MCMHVYLASKQKLKFPRLTEIPFANSLTINVEPYEKVAIYHSNFFHIRF